MCDLIGLIYTIMKPATSWRKRRLVEFSLSGSIVAAVAAQSLSERLWLLLSAHLPLLTGICDERPLSCRKKTAPLQQLGFGLTC